MIKSTRRIAKKRYHNFRVNQAIHELFSPFFSMFGEIYHFLLTTMLLVYRICLWTRTMK